MTMPPLFSHEPRQGKKGKGMEGGLDLRWDKTDQADGRCVLRSGKGMSG